MRWQAWRPRAGCADQVVHADASLLRGLHARCMQVGWLGDGALGEIVRSVDLPSSSLLRRLWHGV